MLCSRVAACALSRSHSTGRFAIEVAGTREPVSALAWRTLIGWAGAGGRWAPKYGVDRALGRPR
ncbi:hypothetical protein B7755_006925 [Streptomyces sp. NBS 14/10]|uniref:hypothetical protein n=1 Tax=Streptomyces sp. NBS 14/10 TaxID=1945643 RepID=UPI00211ACB3D|nr:hypothetical protein [Streptomyces sp. NBS 14/10]KAK1177916.1 hypothetical protein B7755_006925 [Streptomyces sp. NBS 14/10]